MSQKVTTVSPSDVVSSFKSDKKTLIIDCRDYDFKEGGYIKGAINIPQNRFQGINVSDFIDDCIYQKVDSVIFYCLYGQVRSVKAANEASRYLNSLSPKPDIQISYLEGGFESFCELYRNSEYVV